MARNQGRQDNQRFCLVIGEFWLGNIETHYSPKQVLMLWDFWREEVALPNSDDQFHDWLISSGRAKDSPTGNELELEL